MKNQFTQRLFQTITVTSFSLALYNSYNNRRMNELREQLMKERLKNDNIQNKNDELLSKNVEQLNTIKDQNNTILDSIKDIVNSSSGSSSNFNSNNSSFENIYNFINSLTPEQTLAIMHISGCATILLSLYSLLSVFYGNKLLDYFNLEKRYPKMGKYIQLRRTFQQYYLLFDITLITIISLAIIYMNILLL